MKPESAQDTAHGGEQRNQDARFAMRLSLVIGVLKLAGKMTASYEKVTNVKADVAAVLV